MTNILNKVMKKDKVLHLIVGAIFGVATYITGAWLLGLIIATIIFVSKEVYDMYKPLPTGFDLADLFADYIGFAFGFWLVGMLHGISTML